jgi:RNA polymerase-binding transcription factor DksA
MTEQSLGNYIQDILDKSKMLEPLASKVEVLWMRWISTPEGDQGEDWCSDCGTHKLKNMRKKDRRRRDEYILDGGNSALERDEFGHCAGCGVYLKVSLIEAPFEVFEECGFSSSKEADAYEIREMLDTVDFQYSDDRELVRHAVVAIADKFIAHHKIKPQPIEAAGGMR